jgi:hypothetical protein
MTRYAKRNLKYLLNENILFITQYLRNESYIRITSPEKFHTAVAVSVSMTEIFTNIKGIISIST